MAEFPMPRRRDDLDGFAAAHRLRPAIVGFAAFWLSWTEVLGRLPTRLECDPTVLKPWLSTVRLIRIEPGRPGQAARPGLRFRYRYRLIGTDHRRYDDRDFTNTYLDETNLSPERVAFLGAGYERLIESRWPIMMDHAHFGAGTGVYECQRILSPLADIDGPVTDLFGIWSYGALIAGEEHTDEITRQDLHASRRSNGEDPQDGD